ncbi:YcgL domain-containing protein [Kangiella sp. TOML190]|uniref:YcgL domain-containing protein n=1 Tax=Kangiella sp. TOML190 TaxID=2931351 RepID=UPI0020419F3C|nr:YcgL domain-containing protein [Kangiella sp. TOML190]
MLSSIYKSAKRPDTYLYVPYQADLADLPETLMAMWGEPELVMHLDLDKKHKLALADINEVKSKLNEEGYYLQMPPSEEDLSRLIQSANKSKS